VEDLQLEKSQMNDVRVNWSRNWRGKW